MNKLSCVLIVRNEERRIERCLKALSWADEIVIIDQKSVDKTVDIARAYTPHIFETEPKLICNPDREYGINKSSHEWVLLIEADEIVDERLRREIVSVLENPSRDIYFVPVKSFFAGKWIKNCGWYPAYIPRLFRKGAVKFQDDIHTNGRFMSGNIGRFESDLLHYSYDCIDDWMDKTKRYTSRMASEALAAGKTPSLFSAVVEVFARPPAIFIRKYFFMKGFAEGWRGLFISISAALGGIFAYFKLCELYEKNSR